MKSLLRKFAALGIGAVISVGAAPAFAEDQLLGIFQTPEGGMDYRATLCGDGKQLCLQLVDLHGKGDTKKNRKYLDQYIVKNMKPAGANKWRGVVTIQDQSANGQVVITPGKQLYVTACAYVVLCADLTLHYVSP